MKAQEYFEKYFENANDVEIGNNACFMFSDFLGEVDEIRKKRNAKSLSALVGVVRELNEKWNSVARKVERKFAVRIIKRNVIWNQLLSSRYPDDFPRKAD